MRKAWGRFGEERIVTVLKIHQITRNKTENQRQVNFIHPTVIKADIRNKKMQFAVSIRHYLRKLESSLYRSLQNTIS